MKKWNELSMAERVPYLKMGVDSGIYDTAIIADRYNKFDGGESVNKVPVELPEIVVTPTLEQKALLFSKKHLESGVPFNDYSVATDMASWRKFITKFTDKGVSNCTLNGTCAYGKDYARASAKTIVTGDPMYEQVYGGDIKPGMLMIQSLPDVPDEDNIFHTAIFSGVADSDYTNQFGDIIHKGDSLYRYSTGKANKGDYRERPKEALMNNHGKTRFRYYKAK